MMKGGWCIDINCLMVYSVADTQEGVWSKIMAHRPNQVHCLKFVTHKLEMIFTAFNNWRENINISWHMNSTCDSNFTVHKECYWNTAMPVIYVSSMAALTTTTETTWPKSLKCLLLMLYGKGLSTHAPDVWCVNEWMNEWTKGFKISLLVLYLYNVSIT